MSAATLYEPGYVIAGKYQLETLLGQGGMGAVWRARNVALDSQVAIKVLRGTGDRAALRGRLVQEARAAAKLTHPAIVKVFDVGETEGGDPFIVMELLQGTSLATILAAENQLSAVQAVRILLPIADALSLAHSKGIVHRDIKPDNIFVVHDGSSIQPKLVDFGIVKIEQEDSQSHLTQAGAVLGSPDYMSPEQARGQEDIDLLTDVWSFCVVLYEAIAGRTPFDGANYNALLRQIVEQVPPALDSLGTVDSPLSAIVMRGLNKQRSDRFASMGQLGHALATWLASQGVYEDICGTTLEARWLRGTDPDGRPLGRVSFASLHDAWPAESGSGVRHQALGPRSTVPAPPRHSDAPVVEPPGAAARWRSRWPIGVALAAAVLGTAVWLSMRDTRETPPAAPAVALSSGVSPPAATTPVSPEPGDAAKTAPVAPPPEAPNEDSAQPAPPKVSSAVGRAPRTGERRPGAAPKSPSTAGAKSASDLISPYQ